MSKNTAFIIDNSNDSYIKLKAPKDYYIGETVLDLSDAARQSEPDFASIDLLDRHVYHPAGRYINHSCSPNTKVDQRNNRIIAIKQISPGDEITFNYLETERKITRAFDCTCSSKNCLGRIEK